MKKAVFLFDYTGIMARPWAEAGYLCYCFDAQHPDGINQNGNITTVGMWLDDDLSKIEDITGSDVDFVFGFPECTDLAVSGAAHFARKRAKNPNFQKEAMDLVRLVERVGEHFDCPWGLENPISVISTMWRKPNYIFQPYEYGGYLPIDDAHPIYPDYIKPRDAYPKKTCIWSGNGFVMPEQKKVPVLPGYSEQHKKLGGKSLKTKNIRSATPRGFAMAVFQANNKI
ncbi:Dcm methylase [Vibrio sp. VNB-15]